MDQYKGALLFLALKVKIRILKSNFLKFFVIIKGDLRSVRKGLDQWTNLKGLFEFLLEKWKSI